MIIVQYNYICLKVSKNNEDFVFEVNAFFPHTVYCTSHHFELNSEDEIEGFEDLNEFALRYFMGDDENA